MEIQFSSAHVAMKEVISQVCLWEYITSISFKPITTHSPSPRCSLGVLTALPPCKEGMRLLFKSSHLIEVEFHILSIPLF